jgi:hypothetical protein
MKAKANWLISKHNVGKEITFLRQHSSELDTFADYNKSAYTPDWIVGVGVKWTILRRVIAQQ